MAQVQPQDLLLVQLIQTASLCWLRKRGLPSFKFGTTTDAGAGTLELQFGLPSTHEQAHQALIEDWLEFSKKTERLHVLMTLLAQTPDIQAMKSLRSQWMDEGTQLRTELFDAELPGVYSSLDAAVQSAANSPT
jgi:hypothetical protein